MQKMTNLLIGLLSLATSLASYANETRVPNNPDLAQIKLSPNEEEQLDDLLVKLYGDQRIAGKAKQDLYDTLKGQGKIKSDIVIQGNINCVDCRE